MFLGHLKKRFLAYLNKDGFDQEQGFIDPLKFHSSFVTLAELFTVVDYENMPYWMYISPYATLVSAFTAWALFFISSVHYLLELDIYVLVETGTYALVFGYKLIITVSVINGKKEYHKLFQALRDDYHYICTEGQKYRDTFFENQRLTFKVCVIISVFVVWVGGSISVCACIIVFITIYQAEGNMDRPLPLPLWFFGYNLHKSPTYEILFTISMVSIFFECYIYSFNMKSQIVWIREIASKADIIVWKLQDLLIDIRPAKNKEESEHNTEFIQNQMREIISMHHAMIDLTENYAAVFKHLLLYEQLSSPLAICMTAYCFKGKLEEGQFKIMLLILCVACIVVVYVPSYLCTHLLEKTQSIGVACWDIPFWNAGPVVRPYLVLMMQMSTRQLPTVAAGFEDFSLQTYAKILTRAYSCFNMLRQADFDLS